MIETTQALVGEETITVPAGTFKAWHYSSGNSHAWIGTEDSIVLKSALSDGKREYVLVKYRQGTSPLGAP